MTVISQDLNIQSPNFSFLVKYDPLLLRLAAEAERYCFSDPLVSLIKQRQLCELVTANVAALVGEYKDAREDLLQLLQRLEASGILQKVQSIRGSSERMAVLTG